MKRRYDLRRSDNYPYQGRKAYNCSGDGLISINTGFPVTSALITWASVPVGDEHAESMSSSSTIGTSSSSSSWDITPQLPVCITRVAGSDPQYDDVPGQYLYFGQNIYINENGLFFLAPSYTGGLWYINPISNWGLDPDQPGALGCYFGNAYGPPAPDTYVYSFDSFDAQFCPYFSSSSPSDSSDSSSTMGESSSSSSKDSHSSISSVTSSSSSGDYGDGWVARGTAVGWFDIALSHNGQYQVAVSSGRPYVSSNYGVTWSVVGTVPSGNWTSVAISDNGQYQTATRGVGLIYISSDYGANWASTASSKNWFCCAMSADGQYQSAVVYSGYIFVSNDYGANWSQVGISTTWTGITISADGSRQYATSASGANKGVYVSTDYGNTWTRKLNIDGQGVSTSRGGPIVTATSSSQIYVSTDSGNTWNSKYTGYTSLIAISDDGKYQISAPFSGKLIISSDYGNTWKQTFNTDNWLGVGVSGDGTYLAGVSYAGTGYIWESVKTDMESESTSSTSSKDSSSSSSGTSQSSLSTSSSSSKDSSSTSSVSSESTLSSSTNEYYGPFTKPRIYVYDYLSTGFRVKYENIPEEIGYVDFSYLAF